MPGMATVTAGCEITYLRNTWPQLRAPIYEEKVVDLIVEKATVKDKKVSKDEILKEDDLPEGYGA